MWVGSWWAKFMGEKKGWCCCLSGPAGRESVIYGYPFGVATCKWCLECFTTYLEHCTKLNYKCGPSRMCLELDWHYKTSKCQFEFSLVINGEVTPMFKRMSVKLIVSFFPNTLKLKYWRLLRCVNVFDLIIKINDWSRCPLPISK